ncbi:high nitrogen upregulated cytochrome P450 monooxygenase 2 [Lentinula aff. detonsa]|uniref:High nitrogen upregulated cytochrome P450 monooxygenase 2 n=1 Tax=Lentinula aff. detonsa TaxID=2804958 RepID=A0AA38NPP3_9AGAR|nr:high nitrogen upregulated cytochrome P450 monooxygenase 2 [Lentinula aff. detonsa]
MYPTTNIPSEVLAVILGLTNHLFFRKYEPFGRTVPYALVCLLVEPILLCLVQAYVSPVQWTRYLFTYGAFYASLLSSIVLYRLSPFHPLAKVPGPMMHKVSKLWSVWICWQGRQHTEFKAMHDKYGPVVRTGPNEISVVDPSAVNDVLGAGGLPKGKWYLARQDERAPSNLLTLTGEKHANRRRIWNRGLNADAIEEYDEILAKSATLLVEGIQARSESQGEVDLTTWFNYFSFDFMAEFVFGGGSDMLKEGKDKKEILELLEHHMITGALVAHIPWFFYLGNRIPRATEATLKMRAYAVEWVQTRLAKGAKVKDLWYHLTDEAAREKEEHPLMKEVVADALLAIVAGADTTSVALTNFFYMILKHPEHYQRVQEEVDRVYADGDATDVFKQSRLKYLSACLDETLRLLPPGLTGGPRQVPRGGRMIAGHFLPEGTQVYLPPYVIHRNPECFYPRTDDFVPSRWLSANNSDSDSEDHKRHNRKAFLSFSSGPANCVGKKLARQEMLMVISLLMQRFKFTFAQDFDWEQWPETMKDFFATSRGPLRVVARTKS